MTNTLPVKKGSSYNYEGLGKVTITSVTSRVDPESKKRKNLVIFTDEKSVSHTVTKYEFCKNATLADSASKPDEKKEESKKPDEKKTEQKPDEEKEVGFLDQKCYVTTVVVHKMGMEDDCEILEALRGFRDNILTQTETGRRLIDFYDEVGPSLSKIASSSDEDLSQVLFIQIRDMAFLIQNGRYVSAIIAYLNVLMMLNPMIAIVKPEIPIAVFEWINENTDLDVIKKY